MQGFFGGDAGNPVDGRIKKITRRKITMRG
jgi:hypothetical protein